MVEWLCLWGALALFVVFCWWICFDRRAPDDKKDDYTFWGD